MCRCSNGEDRTGRPVLSSPLLHPASGPEAYLREITRVNITKFLSKAIWTQEEGSRSTVELGSSSTVEAQISSLQYHTRN